MIGIETRSHTSRRVSTPSQRLSYAFCAPDVTLHRIAIMQAIAKRLPKFDGTLSLRENMPNASRSERQTEDNQSSVLHTETVSRKMNKNEDVRRLMKTAFPRNELIPLWVLSILALRKSINFRAFYEDERFCGIMYTAEND